MDTQPAPVVTWPEIQAFVREVLAQHRLAAEPSIFKEGNERTLSIFSELQYFLRSRDLQGVGPVHEQALPAVIKKVVIPGEPDTYVLEFLEDLPTYAKKATVVHSDIKKKQDQALTGEARPIIVLHHPEEAIAVTLSDGGNEVRLVTFVTRAVESPTT
ncbi:hypothetical protein [Nocardia xishanensis]|uniref:Uncharacterized protein n=1 Tax=Nocardia xishanensis TaxID=238964 RepID=A0ABW7X9Z7_9NOCA